MVKLGNTLLHCVKSNCTGFATPENYMHKRFFLFISDIVSIFDLSGNSQHVVSNIKRHKIIQGMEIQSSPSKINQSGLVAEGFL